MNMSAPVHLARNEVLERVVGFVVRLQTNDAQLDEFFDFFFRTTGLVVVSGDFRLSGLLPDDLAAHVHRFLLRPSNFVFPRLAETYDGSLETDVVLLCSVLVTVPFVLSPSLIHPLKGSTKDFYRGISLAHYYLLRFRVGLCELRRSDRNP